MQKHNVDEDMALFREYANSKRLNQEGKIVYRDIALRNKLVTRNQRLVLFVISKFFSKRQLPQEVKQDMFQEGCLSLFDAIDNFDPTRGFKFSTYSVWWIRQACNNFLMDHSPELHVPSHVRSMRNKLARDPASEGLLTDLDNPMVAEKFGMTDKMVECIKSAVRSSWMHSLDEPRRTDDGSQTLGDAVADTKPSQESLVDNDQVADAAARALSRLPERERLILLLRYNVIQSV